MAFFNEKISHCPKSIPPPEMSIALSATIRPSRHLTIALWGMSLVVMGGVLITLFELSGKFSFDAKMITTVASLLGVGIGCYRFHRRQRIWCIAISGTGHIRLGFPKSAQYKEEAGSKVFKMMPHATLWHNMLLLRLRAEDGQTISLRILPDSVTAEEFRALSVALRWIVARGALSDQALILQESTLSG
ncbi:MAG: flagellar hook-length control protein [Oxalobacter sp.]|nr:MAG: flagellar hook-length control protein [Oxalobacter sp.]